MKKSSYDASGYITTIKIKSIIKLKKFMSWQTPVEKGLCLNTFRIKKMNHVAELLLRAFDFVLDLGPWEKN